MRLSGRQWPSGNNQVIMCNVQPHGTTEPWNHGTSRAKWDGRGARTFLVIRVCRYEKMVRIFGNSLFGHPDILGIYLKIETPDTWPCHYFISHIRNLGDVPPVMTSPTIFLGP